MEKPGARARFCAYVRAGRHQRGSRLLPFDRIAREIGGDVHPCTIGRWMRQDFPLLAGQWEPEHRRRMMARLLARFPMPARTPSLDVSCVPFTDDSDATA